MAAKRERPFAQFNFLVDLGTGNADGPEAGLQECSNIGMEVTVAEYSNGNEKGELRREVTGPEQGQGRDAQARPASAGRRRARAPD